MRTFMLFVIVSLVISGCITKESKSVAHISGAYVREYSFKVVNPESGAEIGTRTIRDSIFVQGVEGQYVVSNKKWMKNNYDTEGWKGMEHSDDRQMSTYQATFNTTDNSLTSEFMAPLYFDLKGRLFRSNTLDAPYLRISDTP